MAQEDLIKQLLSTLPPSHFASLLTGRLPEPRVCQACGKVLPVGDSGINVITAVTHVVGVSGHPGIPPWQCPKQEHWACSAHCWSVVAHDCIDNHMLPILQQIEKKITGK